MVEHSTADREVLGSTPSAPSPYFCSSYFFFKSGKNNILFASLFIIPKDTNNEILFEGLYFLVL